MSKVSSKVKSDSLSSRIESSSSRLLISVSCSRCKSLNSAYVMDLSSFDKYFFYVHTHRFCDLVTTESDYKLTSAFYSLRIMLMDMRRISSLHTLYVVSCWIYRILLR